jgi:kinetochore protein NDC80
VIAKRAELARIEKAVAEQNLSPDEVQRMNHERESLKRNLDDLRTKVAEVSQQSYNQELMVTKMIDLFEQLLSEYTSLGHQIGIIQPLADGETSLGPDGVDYNIQIDMGTEDILHVQTSGQRMSEVIKPALQAYSESFRRQVSELANEQISLEDDLDKVGQRVDGLRADCDNLEVKLKLASDQAELARRVSFAL